MPDEKTYSDIGELKFEFIEELNADDDLKFTLSVKNLLVLIKDFYGASSSAVYWFNKYKGSFKLLASSEDDQWSNYTDRFKIGDDILSKACLMNSPEIYDGSSKTGIENLSCLKSTPKVKSVIINPIEIDGEVLAAIICESKTENFFGNPNLYSLQVFSDSIVTFIKYYSIKEESAFVSKYLREISSGTIKRKEDLMEIAEKVLGRYFTIKDLAVILYKDRNLEIYFAHGESYNILSGRDVKIEEGSIVQKSVSDKNILVYHFGNPEEKNFRFFKGENINGNNYLCCIPFYVKDEVIGAIVFETSADVTGRQKDISKIVTFLYPFLYYLKILNDGNEKSSFVVHKKNGLYDKKFFEIRLSSEINRCRTFNTHDLIVAYSCIDNTEGLLKQGISVEDVLELYINELKSYLSDFDMMFMLDNNMIGLIICSENTENVYLELEKIRKSVAAKIYNIEQKEISFTVSFGLKKFDDLQMEKDVYLNEITNIIESTAKEGGNLVKF